MRGRATGSRRTEVGGEEGQERNRREKGGVGGEKGRRI